MDSSSNQKVINSVNGNVMAWLAYQQHEREEAANDVYCKNCGLDGDLTDGLCSKCEKENIE